MKNRNTAAHAEQTGWGAITRLLMSLAPLLVGFVGCGGSKVIHLETDPSFTYQAASSAAIAVVGVTSAVGDDEYKREIRNEMPRLLAERVADERPDLSILDPARIEQSYGTERLNELLDRYEQTGRLDTSDVIGLFDATRGLMRYAVFARIELDSVARTLQEDNISADHKTERFLQVAFRVYDITAADLVFDGTIERSDYDLQIDATGGEDSDGGILGCAACLLDFLSWFEDKDEEGFPPPPKLEGLVKSVFDKFAEQLPQAETGQGDSEYRGVERCATI